MIVSSLPTVATNAPVTASPPPHIRSWSHNGRRPRQDRPFIVRECSGSAAGTTGCAATAAVAVVTILWV
jgi:hypothetical protein